MERLNGDAITSSPARKTVKQNEVNNDFDLNRNKKNNIAMANNVKAARQVKKKKKPQIP